MLRITTLGGLAVHRGDRRLLGAAAQPRRLALLAMIARAGPLGIGRERLQATLWPDADPESGRHALKQALYALRRDCGPDEILHGTRELSLDPNHAVADVVDFEASLRAGDMEGAVARYGGPFLAGFRLSAVPEFEHWMAEERRGLERALAEALEVLAGAALSRGDPVAAVHWCRRQAALEPLNERLTLTLMRALLATGDRVGALRQAGIYEDLITQQLDLSPHESVIQLARDIREGRVLPAPPVTPTLAGEPQLPPIPESPPLTSEASVAVLPFKWTDHDTGALADGLTEELTAALAKRPGLVVSGRATSGGEDPVIIGRRLGVAHLVEGTVRRVDGVARIAARLIRVRDGALLWTERFDRGIAPTLALQDELAATIAGDVERELRRAAGLVPAPPPRERADLLYAEGIRAWSPQGAGLGQGLERFRQAVALDPTHALAHAALAESYTQRAFYGFLPADRAAALAVRAAETAMALAPDLAESHLAHGTCLLWVQRRFEAGIRELERALEIDPTLITAQARLAFVRLCHDGPPDGGRVVEPAPMVTAATGLSRVMFGQQLLAAGRYGEAIEALHAAIDIETPSFLAYHWLTMAYVEKGMGAEAVAAAVAEASLSDRHPWSLMSLVVASAAAGQRRRAETLLGTLTTRAAAGHVQASVLAQAHAALGDLDTGMTLLERGIDERDPAMMMIRAFPMFRSFHQHPKFGSLLQRAGWLDWNQ